MRSHPSHMEAISFVRAMVGATSKKRNRELEKHFPCASLSPAKMVDSLALCLSKVMSGERYQRFSRKSIFNSVRILLTVLVFSSRELKITV